jgi:hypothetical protein
MKRIIVVRCYHVTDPRGQGVYMKVLLAAYKEPSPRMMVHKNVDEVVYGQNVLQITFTNNDTLVTLVYSEYESFIEKVIESEEELSEI